VWLPLKWAFSHHNEAPKSYPLPKKKSKKRKEKRKKRRCYGISGGGRFVVECSSVFRVAVRLRLEKKEEGGWPMRT
jgi:hypothetical protein